MHFFPAKLWYFTTLVTAAFIGTANYNVTIAGGDPNIKDKKIYKTGSNIKQHNHGKLYNKEINKNIGKTSEIKNSSKTAKQIKSEDSTVSGFSAVEDEPLIVDLSSVIDILRTPISGVFIFLTLPPIASLRSCAPRHKPK